MVLTRRASRSAADSTNVSAAVAAASQEELTNLLNNKSNKNNSAFASPILPNYNIVNEAQYSPVSIRFVSIFFLALGLVHLLLLVLTIRGEPVQWPFVALTAFPYCFYIVCAWVSISSPRLAVLLSLLAFCVSPFFPRDYPLMIFILNASNIMGSMHFLELAVHREKFKPFNVWWRTLFGIGFLDIRRATPFVFQSPAEFQQHKLSTAQVWKKILPQIIKNNLLMDFHAICACLAGLALSSIQNSQFGLVSYPLRWLFSFVAFSFVLEGIDSFYGFMYSLLGYVAEKGQNRVWAARNLSDFWAKRWNGNTHRLLRQYCYEPFHGRNQGNLGVLAAFLGSAFLHVYPALCCGLDFYHTALVGLFFVVQAVWITVERKFPILRNRLVFWTVLISSLGLVIEPFFHLAGYSF
jgi:hypothetical protein